MDFHGGFQAAVMSIGDIGVAAADMGVDHAILRGQGGEQRVRVASVGVQVGTVGQQGVGGPADLPTLVAEKDIAIATDGGVTGPFIAGKGDEPPIGVIFRRYSLR